VGQRQAAAGFSISPPGFFFFSFMLPVTSWLGRGHLHGRDHEDH